MYDDDVRERLYDMQPSGRSPTKDELSGEPLTELDVFLALRHPSGARMERTAAQAPVVSDSPLPDTASSCAAERDRLRLEIREHRAFIAARAPLDGRFVAGAPNPKLTAEVRRRLVAAFPRMHTVTMEVQCRGNICGASWPTGPGHWASETHRDPWFRTMTAGFEGDRSLTPPPGKRIRAYERYFQVRPAPYADGSTLLRDLVDQFERSTVTDDCAARFPATGSLHVRFELRGTVLGREEDEPPRLSARLGHTLAGTPLGNCLREAIETHILAARLPSPVTHASDYRQLDFPRPRRQLSGPAADFERTDGVFVVSRPTSRR